MVDIKPSILRIAPFDALIGTSVYFTYTGSKQLLYNNLVITDVSTGAIVYNHEYSSFEKVHHIPPNILQNGKIYKAKIRVKFSDDTYSLFSNEIEFKTFRTPVLDIDNIDGLGHVYNSDVTFVANYSQENGEQVKTYRFRLYDENEDLIEEYPIRFPSDPNIFTETVKGLEKGKCYFIECAIETVNGIFYSHRERFIPMYIVPSVNGVILTRNDKEEGFIRITANLKQILGTQVKGSPKQSVTDYSVNSFESERQFDTYEYLDEEWIIVPNDNPVIFRGLGMNRASDFVLKAWCKNIPNNTKFLELSPTESNGISIQFWKYKDRIIAIKEFNGIVARYCSNIVPIPKDAEFMVYAKSIEHRIDLSLKLL